MTSDRDAGLQPERTLLAWNRTAAAMAANAVLLLRAGFQPHAGALLQAGAVLACSALALFAAGRMRRRQLAAGRPQAPAARLLLATCAAVVLAALAGGWSTRF